MSTIVTRQTTGRRRVPSHTAAALALALALGAAGCGGGEPESAESKNPDLLTVAIGESPESADPAAIASNGFGRVLVMQGYDRLLDVATEGPELVPSLATEVPSPENGGVSPDGTTYTFQLRDDVTFQDGSDLTAQDVIYSWERVMTMSLPEGMAENFDVIEKLEAPDDHTVVVTLQRPDASFLYNVVLSMAASVVNPDVVEANGGVQPGTPNEYMAQNMAGSGQYELTSWEVGERLSFETNDSYWGEPAKEDMRWAIVEDQNVWVLGLRSGDYDIVPIFPDMMTETSGADGVEVNGDLPGLQLTQIGFNLNIDPETLPDGDTIPADFFQDKRVRQAFSYAFDYEAMGESVLGGAATRGSFVLPEGMLGYDADAPRYEFNLDEAERLFRESGWWDQGFTLSIVAEGGNLFEDQALLLKDGLESLNPKFHLNVLGVPEARFDEIVATQPMPTAMWSWGTPEFGDPDGYYMDSAHPDGRWGSIAGLGSGYADPDGIAAMIEEARFEANLDVRQQRYAELQQVMYEEAPSILTAQENTVIAYRDWVDGFVVNPMWPRAGMRFALYSKN